MKVWAGLLGLCLAAGTADAASIPEWLKTAAFAGHQTNYSGVFVYQYGNHVETSRISHVVETDSEYEKLESLDGPKREIIRHHGQVWCYQNHKMVQVDSQQAGRFPFLLPDQLAALNENYQAKELGTDRVAGYNAQVVLYQPRDSLRYAHKIWVHTESGLLLKSAVLNEKNQVVEQYAFTELKIGGDIDRSWVVSSAALPGFGRNKPVQSKPVVNSGWVVDALPGGFKKTMEIMRPMRGKHAPVSQLVFSDGLSAISVFIEPADADEDDNEGLTSRGAVNLYHKVVDKHLYNVVGEVPPRAVMQVLDSIRFNGNK
ncbi:MAG: MucB/RseB C-terminal domain-containing protein [Gallionella sp.]|jgi:sigma-E factor negative regulatory protein RseB